MTVLTYINWVKPAEPIFLTSKLIMGGPALIITGLILNYFALYLAAFMPGPSNMRPAIGVSSYKNAYNCNYEKVVSCGPNM